MEVSFVEVRQEIWDFLVADRKENKYHERLCSPAAYPAEGDLNNCHYKRIYAFGDIHGDAELLFLLLTETIQCVTMEHKDGKLHLAWRPSFVDVAVVCTGDMLDRPRHDSRRHKAGPSGAGAWPEEENFIIYLWAAVTSWATTYQSGCFLVMGNHEVMNALRQYKYMDQTQLERRLYREGETWTAGGTGSRDEHTSLWYLTLKACHLSTALRLNNIWFSHGDPRAITETAALEEVSGTLWSLAFDIEKREWAHNEEDEGRTKDFQQKHPSVDTWVMGHTLSVRQLKRGVYFFNKPVECGADRPLVFELGDQRVQGEASEYGISGARLVRGYPTLLYLDAAMTRGMDWPMAELKELDPKTLLERRPQCLVFFRDKNDRFTDPIKLMCRRGTARPLLRDYIVSLLAW